MSSCHHVTRATPPCHYVTRAPSPTIGSRLHLLLLLLELLLFLVSVLGFALLSSARFFALVFPEAARFYFFHDKSFAFYAALLLIFFVLSNSVGFLHARWRRGAPNGRTAKIVDAFVFHPILRHFRCVCLHRDVECGALLDQLPASSPSLLESAYHVNSSASKPSSSSSSSSSSSPLESAYRVNTARISASSCKGIFLIHAVFFSLPSLLIQLYVRAHSFSSSSPIYDLHFYAPWRIDHTSSSSSSSSSSSATTSSKAFAAMEALQWAAIFVHAMNYIVGVAAFVAATWTKTEDRGSKTEDRGSKTEDRGSKSEDRGSKIKDPAEGIPNHTEHNSNHISDHNSDPDQNLLRDNKTYKVREGQQQQQQQQGLAKENPFQPKHEDNPQEVDEECRVTARGAASNGFDVEIGCDGGGGEEERGGKIEARDCVAGLESDPRKCVMILVVAWAALVLFTLPNVLQLFVRGRAVAAIVLAFTFNALPIPLVINNKSCLQFPTRNLFILTIVILYEMMSNVYLWSVFNEIAVNNNNNIINNNLIPLNKIRNNALVHPPLDNVVSN